MVEWGERADGGGLAILHWIGHGEYLTATEEGGGPLLVLYCADTKLVRGKPVQRRLDWQTTRSGMERAIRAPIICFIDACQDMPTGALGKGSSPWEDYGGEPASRAAVLTPGRRRSTTYCADRGVNVGGDFTGGALFSEAIRLALSRFGGGHFDDDVGCAVYMEPLLNAADLRLQWWRRKGVPVGPDDIQYSRGDVRFYDPIVFPERPSGMVEVKPPPHWRDRCGIARSAPPLDQRFDPLDDCYAGDLDHGQGYRATIFRKSIVGEQERGSKSFDIDGPWKRVTVPCR